MTILNHGDTGDCNRIIASIPSDISNLARDAALAPVREFTTTQLATVQPKDIRNIQLQVIQYFS